MFNIQNVKNIPIILFVILYTLKDAKAGSVYNKNGLTVKCQINMRKLTLHFQVDVRTLSDNIKM